LQTPSASIVSGDGSNLATVTAALLDAAGAVLDSERSSVGGSSASGSHEVRTRSGDAASVELTVTDSEGNATSDTRSV
jgi:hypothetical protein